MSRKKRLELVTTNVDVEQDDSGQDELEYGLTVEYDDFDLELIAKQSECDEGGVSVSDRGEDRPFKEMEVYNSAESEALDNIADLYMELCYYRERIGFAIAPCKPAGSYISESIRELFEARSLLELQRAYEMLTPRTQKKAAKYVALRAKQLAAI